MPVHSNYIMPGATIVSCIRKTIIITVSVSSIYAGLSFVINVHYVTAQLLLSYSTKLVVRGVYNNHYKSLATRVVYVVVLTTII